MKPAFARIVRWMTAVVVVLSLAGCATGFPVVGGQSPYGGYPDRAQGGQQVSGTVDYFDPSSGRLVLVSDAYSGQGGRIEMRVDRSTRVFYQGQEADPSGLERGDGVRVSVQDDGRMLWARSIEVVRNVREGGNYGGGNYGGNYGGGYGGDSYGGGYGGSGTGIEGAVRGVDLRGRMIEITRGGYSGGIERVYYDERTRFEYRGQPVRPENLESGDVVRIQGRQTSSGWQADYVVVTVDARSR